MKKKLRNVENEEKEILYAINVRKNKISENISIIFILFNQMRVHKLYSQ